jgi:mono/diheme cytochrome c family protein
VAIARETPNVKSLLNMTPQISRDGSADLDIQGQQQLAEIRMTARLFKIVILSMMVNADGAEKDDFLRLHEVHCIDCHDVETQKGGLDLDSILTEDFVGFRETWETVLRRVRAREMPPPGKPRPDEASYAAIVDNLSARLDALPLNPGRTPTFRRLTRTEYRNAIRDLLALEIDPVSLLPKDESSHGFDNITVSDLSPTLLNRYVAAAQKISRLAIGRAQLAPGGRTIRVKPDITQEGHVEGLPLGTRGGVLIEHTFPATGEYEIEVRLARDRNEHVEGLQGEHELEFLLGDERLNSFKVRPPKGKDHSKVDLHLRSRITVDAGRRQLGVTFVKKPTSLLETKRQPYEAHFNMHRHPRQQPAVFQVSITGPYEAREPGETPSRERIFGGSRDAEEILMRLATLAWRRSVDPAELERQMEFFRAEEDFETGIEMALSSILVSPEFLFRIEREPAEIGAGEAYQLSEIELASRLSFFIWSSIPDEQLLAANLHDSAILEAQTRRMLADSRSSALTTNFASQWLQLRNLDSITPDGRLFTGFDDNLRQAFRRETEMLFESVVREDRSVVDLLAADYTFLNERLAKHYGIPHIYGSRFRRVELGADSQRGGILRHGSILTLTSYATRTSPVLRGNWILENILGTPPPPPPPDVPALEDNSVDANLPLREKLAVHRENKACSVCHDRMDPPGFALENFDAVGRWRAKADARGGLPDGNEFDGVDGLEAGLLKRPEQFVSTLTEKLMTYALGRGVEPFDQPAIRKIVQNAKSEDFRFLELITGIAKSAPFTMRSAAAD